jgi:hypothetical protein
MMIDATVAPKVGFISPFGTTVCNVNHINARGEPRPPAGARYEQRLVDVGSSARFGSLAPDCTPENVRTVWNGLLDMIAVTL